MSGCEKVRRAFCFLPFDFFSIRQGDIKIFDLNSSDYLSYRIEEPNLELCYLIQKTKF